MDETKVEVESSSINEVLISFFHDMATTGTDITDIFCHTKNSPLLIICLPGHQVLLHCPIMFFFPLRGGESSRKKGIQRK